MMYFTYLHGGPPPAPEPDSESRLEELNLPSKIGAAMHFVAMCNANMGLRGHAIYGGGFMEPPSTEFREAELHPAQEAAFRMACQALGDYFSPSPQRKDQHGERGRHAGGQSPS